MFANSSILVVKYIRLHPNRLRKFQQHEQGALSLILNIFVKRMFTTSKGSELSKNTLALKYASTSEWILGIVPSIGEKETYPKRALGVPALLVPHLTILFRWMMNEKWW